MEYYYQRNYKCPDKKKINTIVNNYATQYQMFLKVL